MTKRSPDYCVAITATGSAKEATKIAETLVDEGLVACVNIVPGVESVYFWQGKRCREKEWLLIMKARQARVDQLKTRLPQLHSYTCPELIVLPITDGLPAYLDWLKQNA